MTLLDFKSDFLEGKHVKPDLVLVFFSSYQLKSCCFWAMFVTSDLCFFRCHGFCQKGGHPQQDPCHWEDGPGILCAQVIKHAQPQRCRVQKDLILKLPSSFLSSFLLFCFVFISFYWKLIKLSNNQELCLLFSCQHQLERGREMNQGGSVFLL